VQNLILIKHSLPEIIETVPAREWTLSKDGQIRCMALAEILEKYSPDVIVSSLEPKAAETGRIISQKLKRPLRSLADLHEHDRSDVGLLAREQFESNVQKFFNDPDELTFGNETANQARERFVKAILSLEKEFPDKNIAVVAHGTVITLFVEKYAGLEPFSFWNSLALPSFVVFSLPHMVHITTVAKAF
jgi:broad specificity phosphatase PhoE